MALNYTPGPWEVTRRTDTQGGPLTLITPKDAFQPAKSMTCLLVEPRELRAKVIASLPQFYTDDADAHWTTVQANAKLIALAPTLFELATELIKANKRNQYHRFCKTWDALEDLIKEHNS